MRLGSFVAIALLVSSASVVAGPNVAAAASPIDVAAKLGGELLGAIKSFSISAAVDSIEAQLALLIEQSHVTDDMAVAAINVAEAAPNISANARTALEELKRLIRTHKTKIGALGDGGLVSFGPTGPGFVGGSGSGSDYH
jgi:hypothetical protein